MAFGDIGSRIWNTAGDWANGAGRGLMTAGRAVGDAGHWAQEQVNDGVGWVQNQADGLIDTFERSPVGDNFIGRSLGENLRTGVHFTGGVVQGGTSLVTGVVGGAGLAVQGTGAGLRYASDSQFRAEANQAVGNTVDRVMDGTIPNAIGGQIQQAWNRDPANFVGQAAGIVGGTLLTGGALGAARGAGAAGEVAEVAATGARAAETVVTGTRAAEAGAAGGRAAATGETVAAGAQTLDRAAETARMMESALRPFREGQPLTQAGRAATKHPEYFGYESTQAMQQALRQPGRINEVARQRLEEVLANGVRTSGPPNHNNPAGWVTYTLEDGRGASFKPNGDFIGFRGPRQP
ncbi:MAG: hypothetical protein KF760_09950 [Candidatus Eremiobacteraeota bacterium]|nr:hypothetical protein [Candidatus Eremiobacteraeota bacterium]MCW5868920.1 hypothetical protein [Candidatus Eremiobacteraeota bacterium]